MVSAYKPPCQAVGTDMMCISTKTFLVKKGHMRFMVLKKKHRNNFLTFRSSSVSLDVHPEQILVALQRTSFETTSQHFRSVSFDCHSEKALVALKRTSYETASRYFDQ